MTCSRRHAIVFSFLAVSLLLQHWQMPASERPSLPSASDLGALSYKPLAAPDLIGLPSYPEVRDVVFAAHNYIRGVRASKKVNEPLVTRGSQGVAVYRKAASAVVLVVTGNFRSDELTDLGVGSGVIVDSTGLILTNYHVVQGFQAILVFLKPVVGVTPSKDLAYAERLVAYDSHKDLALLRLVKPPANLPTVAIGSGSRVEVGEDIHVIGHPGGEQTWSYTTGVISQIRPGYEAVFSDGTLIRANVLQIQTSINPGNSGGPVLDDSGTLIGLATFGMPNMQNMNFAIAVDEIATFLARARQLTTRGSTTDASDSIRGEYSVAQWKDGRSAVRIRFPDLTLYLLREPTGRPFGLVGETSQRDVVQAWDPGPAGGFNEWLINLADGTSVRGAGKSGLPEVFVAD